MKRPLAFTLSLGMAALAAAQVDDAVKADAGQSKAPPVLEILKRADKATRAVKSVKYEVSTVGKGDAEPGVPKVTGTVILAGESEVGLSKFRMEIKVDMPGRQPFDTTLTSNGSEFYRLDPATKTYYADIDRVVFGQLGDPRFLQMVGMREFIHPSPFGDELNGEVQEFVGVEKVGDHETYKVHVVYANEAGEAHWWFSTKDYLPRQVERIIPQGGSLVVTVRNLEPDPEIKESVFRPEVPEGWTKTDKPAP